MSNYQNTDDRISFKMDSNHISIHSFFTGLKNHWNSVSGFNTQSPYAGLNEKKLFWKRNPERTALIESFNILLRYIDDILALKPDAGNHDINLKTQLEIKKTEMNPLLPDSCQSLSYDDRGTLFSIYQLVVKIHSDFLILQDLLQINGDFSRYFSVLLCEKAVIESALSFIRGVCSKNPQDLKSTAGRSQELIDVSREYKKLMEGLKQNVEFHSGNPGVLQIMKKFADIDRTNEKLCGKLMSFSKYPEAVS